MIGGVDLTGEFGENFGDGIPITRRERGVYADRKWPLKMLLPDYLAAAGEDDARNMVRARRFHNVMNGNDVVRKELRHEIVIIRRGGEMNDRVHAGGGAVDLIEVGDIADDAFRGTGGGDLVEPTYKMAALHERFSRSFRRCDQRSLSRELCVWN